MAELEHLTEEQQYWQTNMRKVREAAQFAKMDIDDGQGIIREKGSYLLNVRKGDRPFVQIKINGFGVAISTIPSISRILIDEYGKVFK